MRSIGCGIPCDGYPPPRNADDGWSPDPGLNVPRGKSLTVGSVEEVRIVFDPNLLILVVVIGSELAIVSLVFKEEFELSFPE